MLEALEGSASGDLDAAQLHGRRPAVLERHPLGSGHVLEVDLAQLRPLGHDAGAALLLGGIEGVGHVRLELVRHPPDVLELLRYFLERFLVREGGRKHEGSGGNADRGGTTDLICHRAEILAQDRRAARANRAVTRPIPNAWMSHWLTSTTSGLGPAARVTADSGTTSLSMITKTSRPYSGPNTKGFCARTGSRRL